MIIRKIKNIRYKGLCSAAAFFAFISPGRGLAAPDSCLHYAGYASIEGKYGSDRHLGDVDIFLPVGCTEKALLFADIRMKGDNRSGREGNVALGVRSLQEQGIAGGYVYFDRLRSGETEKMHSQLTFGVEWLAQTWEVRGNAYLPVTGEKQIETAPSVAASNPFLDNGGIFVRTSGNQILREEPMYGMDTETGFKLPGADFWMHVGGFAFDAEDAPSMRGVRARARLDITENVSLSAEGQYDNQRGRQGWVGVRLSVPFGGPAQKPQGLKARMTAPLVRDVDIVTAAEETRSHSKTVPVINIETGEAQRVLHVDNMAAPGGSGTLENPFNTLAAAEAAMQAHDVIYVHAGDGTSAGQDQGITLARTGVLFIGSGTDFIYDADRFRTFASGADFNSMVIAAATTAPVITNGAGSGINITADDVEVAGVTVSGATNHGIYARNNTGAAWENTTVHDVTLSNNAFAGLLIQSTGVGSSIANAAVSDVTATGNVQRGVHLQADTGGEITTSTLSEIDATANSMQGIYVYTSGGGQIDALTLQDITGSGNTGGSGNGMELRSENAGSSIGTITAANIITSSNAKRGIYVVATGGGAITTATLDGITSSNNTDVGLQINVSGAGSAIASATASNVSSSSNSSHGVHVIAQTGGQIGTATLDGVTSNNNTASGSGLKIESTGAGSSITSAIASNVTTTGNSLYGTYVTAAASQIGTVTLEDLVSTGNTNSGVYILSQSGSRISTAILDGITSNSNTGASGSGLQIVSTGAGSSITSAMASNVTTTGNSLYGTYVTAAASSQIGAVTLEDLVSTGNANRGVYIISQGGSQISTTILEGLTSSNNTGAGLQILSTAAGSSMTNITVSDAITNNNTQQGVYVTAQTSGQIGTATLEDMTSNGNAQQGLYVQISSASQMGTLVLDGITANSNTGASGTGLQILSTGAGSSITNATVDNVTTTGNSLYGTYVAAQSGGQISTAALDGITANNNIGASGRGLYIQSDGAGSAITNSTIRNVTASGNAQRGVYVAANAGSLSASLQSVTATGSGGNGIFIDDDTAAAFTADLGGGVLGSLGQNRFFGNTGTDIFVDMDGLELKAENNWWGNAAGLLPARRTLDGVSTIDSSPFLAVDPNP